MKKLLKVILVFIFVCLLTGCNERSTYEISLDGSSDSYYNWTYEIEDPLILSVVEENYYGHESEDEIVGLDGEYVFKVEALVKGKTKVNFKYMKSWEVDDVLYEYSVEFEVDDKLNIELVSEDGNYLSLEKFLAYDIEKLGLDENFNEYKLIFDNNVVTIDNRVCDFLTIYDYNDDIIGAFGISKSDTTIYKMIEGEMVIVE